MSERRPACFHRFASRGIGIGALVLGGCTADYHTHDADREVGKVLGEFDDEALGDRAERIVLPKVVEPPPEEPLEPPATELESPKPPAAEPEPTVPALPPMRLDLRTSLAVAVEKSRDFQDARETLYLSGLGFTFTRFLYGPQFDSAVSYVWGDSEDAADTSASSLSLGVSQLLPTNGTISASGSITKDWVRDDGGAFDDWSSGAAISLTQPLLRGAGYGLYREALTQAERDMVYSVRSFELFRQDFTINITSQFFALVGQKRKLVNIEQDLEDAINDEEKNIQLRRIDRVLDKDVIQARRRRLNVESQLEDAVTAYRRSIEQFLIDLGLDPRTPIELVEEEPPYDIVNFDPGSAVEVAMHNRLDVQTQRDQIEDAERQFELARNDLLPDLNVSASYASSGSDRHPGTALPETWSRSASVSLEIPLQTIDRRNRWRSAEISIARTRRDWDLFVDQIKSSVEDAIRQLANTERQIELSEESILDEADNVELMEVRQEQGTADAREVLEARQSLVNARNNLIDQKVQHLIQQLRLYRNLGLLFIGPDGFWSVGAPATEDSR